MFTYLKVNKEEIKQINLKNINDNIKSNYILQKIFHNLSQRKLLIITKYNKNIKKRLNVNATDYEKYLSIEIHIIPSQFKYGKFINIKKEEELYYHIYFNNNKEEIKKNYLEENEEIYNIDIIIDYQVKSLKDLFSDCVCVESIDFRRFNRNNIFDMSGMFKNCSSLKKINISNIKTKNVVNIYGMFFGCSSLKEVDISNFSLDKIIYNDESPYAPPSLTFPIQNFPNFTNFPNMMQMFNMLNQK